MNLSMSTTTDPTTRPVMHQRPDRRMPCSTLAWASGAVAAALVTGYVLVRVFLHSYTGAAFDTRMMNILDGPPEAFHRIALLVHTVSPMTVALTLLLTVGVALARRRAAVAAAAVTVVIGGTTTTQFLKWDVLDRVGNLPNALPSGHSTAGLLWAIGAVLVAPRRWRPAVTVIGTVVACTIGVGTIARHWHRPSDVIAAAMVCLGWAAASILCASIVQRRARPSAGAAGRYAVAAVIGAALASLVFFALGFVLNGQGFERVGAFMVLEAVICTCAATIAWVAWFAERELG